MGVVPGFSGRRRLLDPLLHDGVFHNLQKAAFARFFDFQAESRVRAKFLKLEFGGDLVGRSVEFLRTRGSGRGLPGGISGLSWFREFIRIGVCLKLFSFCIEAPIRSPPEF